MVRFWKILLPRSLIGKVMVSAFARHSKKQIHVTLKMQVKQIKHSISYPFKCFKPVSLQYIKMNKIKYASASQEIYLIVQNNIVLEWSQYFVKFEKKLITDCNLYWGYQYTLQKQCYFKEDYWKADQESLLCET